MAQKIRRGKTKRWVRLSDNKPTGFCFECGVKLYKKNQKYCCENCKSAFYEKNDYHTFRAKIIRERGFKCEECPFKLDLSEKQLKYFTDHPWIAPSGLELHHIKLLCEGGALMDEKNCQSLCVDCHKAKRRKTKPTQAQEILL